jgi:hypothetical protein
MARYLRAEREWVIGFCSARNRPAFRERGKSVIDPPMPKAKADEALASDACTVSHRSARCMGSRLSAGRLRDG